MLFSGQAAMPDLVAHAADYSPAILAMLIVCKALVYGLSLSAFRGGPVFPSMFIGAALGIAASGLPGMDLAAGIGMGIGAMCAAMLRLPLTSTLLATLLLGADGLAVTPQVIVAVAVAYVVTIVLPTPGPKETDLLPGYPAAGLSPGRISQRAPRRLPGDLPARGHDCSSPGDRRRRGGCFGRRPLGRIGCRWPAAPDGARPSGGRSAVARCTPRSAADDSSLITKSRPPRLSTICTVTSPFIPPVSATCRRTRRSRTRSP